MNVKLILFTIYINPHLYQFLQILDDVEKRRGISPALVQPFMRAIIDAPFPALGKKISVKNFLPGSGTEVWQAKFFNLFKCCPLSFAFPGESPLLMIGTC